MEENIKRYEKKEEKDDKKPEKSEKKGFWKRLKEKRIGNQQAGNQKELEMKKAESEKQQLLQKSEVSIWIDTYDDVFSDFDSRPYSQRAISDDFIRESQKMYKESRRGKFELHCMAQSAIRNEDHENMIKKRLN